MTIQRALVRCVIAATMVTIVTTVGVSAAAADTRLTSGSSLTASTGIPIDSTSPKSVPSDGPVASEPGGVPQPRTAVQLQGTDAQSRTSTAPDSCRLLSDKVKAGTVTKYAATCASITPGTAAPASKDSMGASALSLPSNAPTQCTQSATPSNTWWALDRRWACSHQSWTITVTSVPSGAVLGTSNIHAIATMVASTTGAIWASDIDVWVFGSTAPIAIPDTSSAALFCTAPSCVGNAGTYGPSGVSGSAWTGNGGYTASGLSSGVIRSNVNAYRQITFNKAGWANPVNLTMNFAPSRCDNATPGTSIPGCVLPTIPGILAFSQAQVPYFVSHVYGAQLSGLPGRLGTGSNLTRLINSTLQAANNTKACPASLTRPTGYQCDEYPFASTYQGASTSGATSARSLSWCQMPDPAGSGSNGWSRCFIPQFDNSSAGGTTGAFYKAQRMLDADPFQIGYLP